MGKFGRPLRSREDIAARLSRALRESESKGGGEDPTGGLPEGLPANEVERDELGMLKAEASVNDIRRRTQMVGLTIYGGFMLTMVLFSLTRVSMWVCGTVVEHAVWGVG